MLELEEKFDNGEFSDGSNQDSEQEHAQRQISEKVDGLAEYQQNLPLSRTKYNDFIKALKGISASILYKQAAQELQQRLKDDPDWRNDENSDYDINKFLNTQLLRDKTDQDVMDWQKAKLVGLFICKHGDSSRLRYLIANHVAKEASTLRQIKSDEFVTAIKPILRIAAIEFTKTVFETEFTDIYYDDSDFKKLENGLEKVCEDLKRKVFGEATELEKKDWMKQALK